MLVLGLVLAFELSTELSVWLLSLGQSLLLLLAIELELSVTALLLLLQISILLLLIMTCAIATSRTSRGHVPLLQAGHCGYIMDTMDSSIGTEMKMGCERDMCNGMGLSVVEKKNMVINVCGSN